MESISKTIKIKIFAAFVFCTFIGLNSFVLAQSIIPLPQINARFSNPQFVIGTRMYYLDVELNSSKSLEALYGMNVRFFYDASMLDFRYFDQFADGYGPLGDPEVIEGNGSIGQQMFSLKGATAFLNGTIQLQNEQNQLQLAPAKWVKVFRVCFRVPKTVANEKAFCPSVFWDIKPKSGSGGFLVGDDGVVITLVENNPYTPESSAPAFAAGTAFNWQQNTTQGMPYGSPVSQDCISLVKLGVRSEADPLVQKEFALFQNQPNPFDHGTVIEFILPATQEISLKFYDVSGRVINEIKAEYKQGKNVINLMSEPWMEGAKVVFYRMETQGFVSNMMKMVFIN